MMDREDYSRRPWVLLPGTLCTSAVFDGLLDAVAVPQHARRQITLRYPRIEAYADDFAAEVPPGAVVCGFSLGAIVAAHHADRLAASALLLFGLNPHADDPAKRASRRAFEHDVRTKGARTAVASRLPTLYGPEPTRVAEQILAMADATSDLIAAHTELALNRVGALDALSRARCTVCALTGSEDDMTPFALAEEAARAAPQGRAVRLAGLGHYALIEHPETCAEAVLSHV